MKNSRDNVEQLVRDFAKEQRLKIETQTDGSCCIRGSRGEIFQYDESQLAVLVSAETTRAWTAARKKLIAAGFTLYQDGDWEGSALFDPENADQANLAIELAGVRRKRQQSPGQLANLRKGPETEGAPDLGGAGGASA